MVLPIQGCVSEQFMHCDESFVNATFVLRFVIRVNLFRCVICILMVDCDEPKHRIFHYIGRTAIELFQENIVDDDPDARTCKHRWRHFGTCAV